jgi:hypothetical protein
MQEQVLVVQIKFFGTFLDGRVAEIASQAEIRFSDTLSKGLGLYVLMISSVSVAFER